MKNFNDTDLANYLEGALPADEIGRLDETLKHDPQLRKNLLVLAGFEAELPIALQEMSPGELQSLSEESPAGRKLTPRVVSAPHPRSSRIMFGRVIRYAGWPALAAAAALIIGIGLFRFSGPLIQRLTSPIMRIALIEGDYVRSGNRIQTPARSRAIVYLKNATEIKMAENTTLEALMPWNNARQTVFLAKGEILNNTAKGNGAFVVRTGAGSVRVTGTRFSVRAESLAGERMKGSKERTVMTVKVLEGQVKVEDVAATASIMVNCGEEAKVVEDSQPGKTIKTLFYDDFEEDEIGKVPQRWQLAPKLWAVRMDGNMDNKVLAMVANKQIRNIASFCLTGNSGWSNYSVQCRAKMLGDEKHLMAAVIAYDRKDKGFYIFSHDASTEEIVLKKYRAGSQKSGGDYVVLSCRPHRASNGQWQILKLGLTNTPEGILLRGKIWQENESEPKEWTIEAHDKENSLSGGECGVMSSMETTYFDDFCVSTTVSGNDDLADSFKERD
ncbi:MAG: FecR family protein [Verrucomicrobia bacterium]|nr:FecR family protein [Verrucomicrobiota bacterium]MCG2681538.1 FecR family protein [Kiritimatiellia bacterium]MBU4248194.1 FecR family protein [Verrucomicrobiota bacterium]MBU4290128.1 FecR family protein [Verrucomicrobiota bacterium]MBU4429930.1 FecR family protein [Verrucomicrobiota bacterium]